MKLSTLQGNVQLYKPQCIHGENVENSQSSKWDLGFDLLALNTVIPIISVVIRFLPHLYPYKPCRSAKQAPRTIP